MRGIIHLFFALFCILDVALALPRFFNAKRQLSKRVDSNATNAARLKAGLPPLKPRDTFPSTPLGG